MKQHTNKPPKALWQEIGNRYLVARESVHTIAKALGYSPHYIDQCLKALGIQKRNRGEGHGANIDEKQLRLLNNLYLTERQIAKVLKVSTATLERAKRRLGLKSKRGHGSPGSSNPAWKGGRKEYPGCYVYIWCPNHPHATQAGYVCEHRLVMEQILGRYLDPKEVVHHKDKNRRNNDPDNLEVFSSNAEHLRHELTGKVPKWTQAGIQRMREGNLRKNRQRSAANQKASKKDASK